MMTRLPSSVRAHLEARIVVREVEYRIGDAAALVIEADQALTRDRAVGERHGAHVAAFKRAIGEHAGEHAVRLPKCREARPHGVGCWR